jgi:hypothetical protein
MLHSFTSDATAHFTNHTLTLSSTSQFKETSLSINGPHSSQQTNHTITTTITFNKAIDNMAGSNNKKTNGRSKKSPPPRKATTQSKNGCSKSPQRQKLEKGHFGLQKQGDIVYIIRLKQNIRVAFVVKANNRGKGSYIQHLVNLIRNNDDSVAHLNILNIVPRRATDGSNNRLMDGHFAMRQFVEVLDEEEENNTASAEKWGRAIAARITELNKTSVYPTICAYGGDLTPDSGPPTVDTHLLNRDVVTIASHLYNNPIIDGSFFQDIVEADDEYDEDGEGTIHPSVASEFFGSIADPRSLFIENN